MSAVLGESWLWPTVALAFIWGSLWGSFLNVVIWRLPRGQSLVHPPSHCPACKSPIRPWDNVPIFGWMWLRGRCRDCSSSISWRYPAVEALCALLHAAIWYQVADGRIAVEPWSALAIPFLFWGYFSLVCVAIALIDLDLTIIPHSLTLPTIVLGIVAALLTPKTGTFVTLFPSVDIVDSVIGLLAGGGVLYLIFQGYFMLTGRVGLGGGDFTTVGMIGAFLGWQSLLFVLLAASVQGIIAALLASAISSRRQKTYGEGGFLMQGAHKESFWEGSAEDPDHAGDAADAQPLPPDEAPAVSEAATAPEAEVGEGADGDDDKFMQLAIPFGPFLTLAAVEYIFIGEFFWRWLLAGELP